MRAVRAGEAKLCGRVTDVASDAGADSWEMSSCLPSLAGAQMLLCVWVLTRFGPYVMLFFSFLLLFTCPAHGFYEAYVNYTCYLHGFYDRQLKTHANSMHN